MAQIERVAQLAISVAAPGLRVDRSRVESFNWQEVAGALASVDSPASALIRGMYAGDAMSLRLVHNRLVGLLMQEPAHDIQAMSKMARIAVMQYAMPQHCVICQGRGTVMIEQVKYDCAACNATGLTPREGKEPTEKAGLSWDEHQLTFERCWAVLQHWHDQAAAVINAKVGRE